MRKFLFDHELTICLTVVWLTMIGVAAVSPEGSVKEFLTHHSSEIFGALVVVFTHQVLRLRERGKRSQPPLNGA